MIRRYIIDKEQDTTRIAERIASLIGEGYILALYGNLGSGKTFFTRALCRALGSNDLVTSPSFVLINQYTTPNFCIHHIDLYRLHSEEDLIGLGLDEFLGEGLTIIEWLKLAERILKGKVIRMDFLSSKGERSVSITAEQDFLYRLDSGY